MPNEQIAVGARTKVLMDVETSYGVAPTTPGGCPPPHQLVFPEAVPRQEHPGDADGPL